MTRFDQVEWACRVQAVKGTLQAARLLEAWGFSLKETLFLLTGRRPRI